MLVRFEHSFKNKQPEVQGNEDRLKHPIRTATLQSVGWHSKKSGGIKTSNYPHFVTNNDGNYSHFVQYITL